MAAAVATMDALEAAVGIWDGLSLVVNRYDLQPGFSGGYNKTDFDYYKVLGHEAVVALFAPLVQERRWDVISRLLDQNIVINRLPDTGAPGLVQFRYASQYVQLLDLRKRRFKCNRLSLHSDLLLERHSGSPQEWQAFADADFLLYLRSVLASEEKPCWGWWFLGVSFTWSIFLVSWSSLSIVDVQNSSCTSSVCLS